MAILKCKMCGGDLNVVGDEKVVECEYCGSKQTVPDVNDEKKVNLFNRANRLRISCEFDKAGTIYEQIIVEFPKEAEAYWGLCLCNYGIEYVDDPVTARKIPTCHRASFEKMRKDENYELALENADMSARIVYEDHAKEIDRIMGEVLSLSKNEKPFDIFICYKETDNAGGRTPDSVLAQDIYDALTEKGYRVFFSRITLEDKLGTQYEPYIFSALNSAKIMLAVGTDYEFFNAVWVKNEWSRFLKLMAKDKSKMLIPCYKDMDVYDMPNEFKGLQSQDCGKLGFMQDLVRGIDKLFGKGTEAKSVDKGAENSATVDSLLERVFMFLEDGKWHDADIYCEKVLDIDPKNAEAYLGKLMAELKVTNRKQLADCAEPFDNMDNYSKVIRFADENLEAEMRGYIAHINDRNENARLTGNYDNAQCVMRNAQSEDEYKKAADIFKSISGFKDADELAEQCFDKAKNCRYENAQCVMRNAQSEDEYKKAASIFKSISGFKDADTLAEQCLDKAEICRKDAIYVSAKSKMVGEKVGSYEEAIGIFRTISGWKDADEQIYACQRKIEEIRAKEEADRLEAERKAEAKRIADEKAAKKRIKIIAITTPIVCVCIAFIIVLTTVIIPTNNYNAAMKLYEAGKYTEAISAFEALDGYKDSTEKIQGIKSDSGYMKVAKVGDTFYFGTYEQDNNKSNGKEDIEWRVLAKENNKILVISEYALDCQQYNTSYDSVTWETCSLRKWMNGTFLNNAFSAEEQAQIQSTNVSADKNPNYSTNPGNATTDKVFLLSITEAEKYFTSNEDRKCVPTAYAIAQGAYTSSSYTKGGAATCWWWLRSPGSDQNYAAPVHFDGSVFYYGLGVDRAGGCVRPVLWINLNS